MSSQSLPPSAGGVIVESTPYGDLLDHEYDGIREFDNPTPGWWHLIFGATIIYSVFYFAYCHFSPLAPSIHERWQSRQVAEFERIFGALGTLEGDETTLRQMMGNTQMLEVAKGIFLTNCSACHGRDGASGGGFVGVNLTDDHWKNVKALPDVFRTINAGAANGAMPAWENRLSQNERVIVAAYVASLRKSPKPGRGPEGEVIPPFPEPIAPDGGGQ